MRSTHEAFCLQVCPMYWNKVFIILFDITNNAKIKNLWSQVYLRGKLHIQDKIPRHFLHVRLSLDTLPFPSTEAACPLVFSKYTILQFASYGIHHKNACFPSKTIERLNSRIDIWMRCILYHVFCSLLSELDNSQDRLVLWGWTFLLISGRSWPKRSFFFLRSKANGIENIQSMHR